MFKDHSAKKLPLLRVCGLKVGVELSDPNIYVEDFFAASELPFRWTSSKGWQQRQGERTNLLGRSQNSLSALGLLVLLCSVEKPPALCAICLQDQLDALLNRLSLLNVSLTWGLASRLHPLGFKREKTGWENKSLFHLCWSHSCEWVPEGVIQMHCVQHHSTYSHVRAERISRPPIAWQHRHLEPHRANHTRLSLLGLLFRVS